MKQLTLCEKCRALYAVSYDVRSPGYDTDAKQPAELCEHCRKKNRNLKVFAVAGKKERNGAK